MSATKHPASAHPARSDLVARLLREAHPGDGSAVGVPVPLKAPPMVSEPEFVAMPLRVAEVG